MDDDGAGRLGGSKEDHLRTILRRKHLLQEWNGIGETKVGELDSEDAAQARVRVEQFQ